MTASGDRSGVAADRASGGEHLDRKVVRGSGWVAVGFGMRSILTIVSMLALVRVLEPKAFGLVALAATFVAVLENVQATGIGVALVYRRDRIEEAAASVLVFSSVAGAGLFLANFAAAPLFARALHTPALTPVLQAMALLLVVRGLAVAPSSILERVLDFRSLAKSELASGMAQVGLSIGLAYAGFGVWSLVVGQVAGAAVGTALVWMLVPWRPSPRAADWGILREMMRYGRLVSAGTILGLFNGAFDNLAIARLLGATPLGYYTVTFRLADFPTSVIGYVVSRVMLPAYLIVQDDAERFRQAFLTNVQRVALLSLPIGVGLAVGARPIVLGLFGQEWLPAVTPLRILAVYSIVRSFASCAGAVFQALGKPHLVPIWALPQTIVGVVMLLLLVPRFGVDGAALAMLVSFAASGLPAFAVATRQLGLSTRDLLEAIGPSFVCAGVLALALGALLLPARELSPVGALALITAGGFLVYVAATAVIARRAVALIIASVRSA